MAMTEVQRNYLQVAGLVLFFLAALLSFFYPPMFVVAFAGAVLFLETRYERRRS